LRLDDLDQTRHPNDHLKGDVWGIYVREDAQFFGLFGQLAKFDRKICRQAIEKNGDRLILQCISMQAI
jgi:hypothetical protein